MKARPSQPPAEWPTRWTCSHACAALLAWPLRYHGGHICQACPRWSTGCRVLGAATHNTATTMKHRKGSPCLACTLIGPCPLPAEPSQDTTCAPAALLESNRPDHRLLQALLTVIVECTFRGPVCRSWDTLHTCSLDQLCMYCSRSSARAVTVPL